MFACQVGRKRHDALGYFLPSRELCGVTALSQPLSTVPNTQRGLNERWADAWLTPRN